MMLFWILIVIVVLVFSLDQLIKRMYHYEKKTHRRTPEKYQIAFDEVRIPGVKNTQLYGWWIPVSPEVPTLILVHGWGRNLARMMPYIRALHPMGYNLLAFDARNHGSSSPLKHPIAGTFSEDILAAVDFLSGSDLISSDCIGVIGLSIGGAAAVNAAGWDQRIKVVIAVGAFSHPVEVMKMEFQKKPIPGFIPWLLFQYKQIRFGIDFDKIAPINNIAKANADIFLIHGDKDKTVLLTQGQKLAHAGNLTRTRLWVVPDRGHSDCNSNPQFWEKVEAFLRETTRADAVL